MRKSIYYIAIVCLLFSQALTAAQANGRNNKGAWKGATRNIHHIAFWGGGGYSGLLNTYEHSKFTGGGGGLLGIGYEYSYDHFILDAGAEFRMFTSLDKVTFPSTYKVALMADGYNQTMNYTFGDPFKENHLVGQAMVPLMLGGRWDTWYFLAGAKVGYTVLGNYSQNGTYTTTITDYDALDPYWKDISHGTVTDAPYAHKGTIGYGLDVAASAEIGLNINGLLSQEWNNRNNARKYPVHLRVAAFADYGVLSMGQAQAGPMAIVDESGISSRSLHTSYWANGGLNSLLVGVKFTALLQMNKPQQPKPAKPAMLIYVRDANTDKGIASATVAMTQTDAKRPRTIRRSTNAKGAMTAKMVPGSYDLNVTHPDYLPQQEQMQHGDWGDTLSFRLTPRPDFRLTVLDAKTETPLAAEITFTNTNDKKKIATLTTDSVTGYAQQHLPINVPIQIRIKVPDHITVTDKIADVGGEMTYRLEPIVKKKPIVLRNLFFATNRATILPESEPELQNLYNLLIEHPEIRIRITGHTDNVGSDRFNQSLSEQRANSVRHELIQRGIDANRIEAEGKGKTEPVATNETEEGRAQNRRVEFMIL
ncbi:MAG: OmpA family protein [Paludibacteraceae bacterium]|nr:OmpA family protein [Paludibacteraceae bacterium]